MKSIRLFIRLGFSFLIMSQAAFGQIRKTELSFGSGYQYNAFKSPELLNQAELVSTAPENGFFLWVAGEFDIRANWGEFVGRRNTQRHQLDVYTTLRTRQFTALRDASHVYGDIQVNYRLRITPTWSWITEAGYTGFLTPDSLKTAQRNIISYGYKRWEGRTGFEFTGWQNHLSKVSIGVLNKDYTSQNSLDRKEYGVKWYARQRFRDAFNLVSYLRLNTYAIYRDYQSTQGSGVDEEGFEVVAGRRQLFQIQSELSYQRDITDRLSIEPGFQVRYRNDISPNRFDYYHLRPSLDLTYETKMLEMDLQTAFTQRNYRTFSSPSDKSDRLQYQYLTARLEGAIHFPKSPGIIPCWDLGWNSRNTNNNRLRSVSFRGYESWYALLGLKLKWE